MNRENKFKNRFLNRLFTPFLITILLLNNTFNSFSAAADDSNPTVDEACSSSFANVGKTAENGDQKLAQCKAGKSAQDAYRASDSLWKVWGAVTAVCIATCAASLGGVLPSIANHACTLLDVAASVTEAVVTKEYTAALSNIAMIGMMAGAQAANGAKTGSNAGKNATSALKGAKNTERVVEAAEAMEKGKKGGTSNSMMICMMAITAGVTTVTKYMSTESSKNTVRTTLANILKYQDNQGIISSTLGDRASESQEMAAKSGKQSNTAGALGNSSAPPAQSSCAQGAAGGNGEAVLQCALSSAASGLPNIASDPRFENIFKDTLGMNLKDFLGSAQTPSSAITAAVGNHFSASQGAALDELLQKIQADAGLNSSSALAQNTSSPEGTYSSGGRGGASSEGEAEPDLMAMMAGIMAQFGPKEPGGANQNDGVMSVIFANQKQHKSTSEIAENKNLNIFDRITYRYYFIIKKNTL